MKEFKDISFAFDIKEEKMTYNFFNSQLAKEFYATLGINAINLFSLTELLNLSNFQYKLIPLEASLLTIPMCIVSIAKLKHKQKKVRIKNLKIHSENLKKVGIITTPKNLKNSFILVNSKRLNETRNYICFFDINNKLKILQESITYQEELGETIVKDRQLFILDDKEIQEVIDSLDEEDSKDFKRYIEKNKNISNYTYSNLFYENNRDFESKQKRNFRRNLLLMLIPTIVLSLANIKKDYGSLENINNTIRILRYYNDSNNLSENDLKSLLKNIEDNIHKVSNNDKYSIENITTKDELKNYLLLNAIAVNQEMTEEEKEIYYNLLDFFNDNPYINYKKTYKNLATLDFIREDEIDEFTKNSINSTNSTTLAYYDKYLNKVAYPEESECSDYDKFHEAVHVVTSSYNMPKSLKEGIADIVTHEYFYDEKGPYISAYCKNVAMTKIVLELTSKNIVLKSFKEDSTKPIYNKLVENQLENGISIEEANNNAYDFLNELKVDFDYNLSNSDYEVVNLDKLYPERSKDDYDKMVYDILKTSFEKELSPTNYNCYFNDEEKDKTLTLN